MVELEDAVVQVLDGTIQPGLVFDAEGYRLMDSREALKVPVRP
ncbi:hypothetical protein ACNHYB_10755 [Isoptericola jiangsuensis]